jgi:hypothetical protein
MRFPVLVLALGTASGTSPRAAGMEAPLAAIVARAVPPGAVTFALESARALAAAHLGLTACREIFEELPDVTGRPVARRLEAAERSPSSAFARLSFVPAADGPCTSGDVAAWSVAGDLRVRVCGRVFAAVAGRDPHEAAAILIHEALHTLGIAEDAAHEPLTAFVRRRCDL